MLFLFEVIWLISENFPKCEEIFEENLCKLIREWFEAKCTDAISGQWLLETFLEILLIGGKLGLLNWVSRPAKFLSFQFYKMCLNWIAFRIAREVLSGIWDAGYAYVKLLKLQIVFLNWFLGTRDKNNQAYVYK